MAEKKVQRYSISVSARTYDRLRAVVPGSLAGFVEDLMTRTLDDPVLVARAITKCHSRKDAAP